VWFVQRGIFEFLSICLEFVVGYLDLSFCIEQVAELACRKVLGDRWRFQCLLDTLFEFVVVD
jgi:hypothetical protein